MNKYPLIGGSICAVILLVLASLTNVIGYQTVQTSNQKMISSEIDQKDLLFQTICDLTNNEEIQKIIQTSQMSKTGFLTSSSPIISTPPITKKTLEFEYHLGLLLSRVMSRTTMVSLIRQHHELNEVIQQRMNGVINNDSTLKEEINQLQALDCHCGNSNSDSVLCLILVTMFTGINMLMEFTYGFGLIGMIVWQILFPIDVVFLLLCGMLCGLLFPYIYLQ